MHLKNSTMRAPRTNKLSTDRQARRWGCPGRTIENRGDEGSGEIGLLCKVQIVWDLRSIRIVRPRLFLSVRHSSGGCEGGEDFGGG